MIQLDDLVIGEASSKGFIPQDEPLASGGIFLFWCSYHSFYWFISLTLTFQMWTKDCIFITKKRRFWVWKICGWEDSHTISKSGSETRDKLTWWIILSVLLFYRSIRVWLLILYFFCPWQEEGLCSLRFPEALAAEHQSSGEHHLWDAHDQAQVTTRILCYTLISTHQEAKIDQLCFVLCLCGYIS